jgi:hypothetical protein
MNTLTQAGVFGLRHKGVHGLAIFVAILSLSLGFANSIHADVMPPDDITNESGGGGGDTTDEEKIDALKKAIDKDEALIAGLKKRIKKLEAELAACKAQKQ